MSDQTPLDTPFRFRRLTFLVVVVFFSFFARMVLSPLLPAIEVDLGISHAVGGSFFFFIALGYSPAMLLSGFFASVVHHRTVIVLAITMAGLGVALVAASNSIAMMRVGLAVVGMGAGMYPPSGITTLTSLTPKERWGAATALHEIGPNLTFVLAPFFAEVMLRMWSWRGALWVTAVAVLGSGFLFGLFSKGGSFRGSAPHFSNVRSVVSDRGFRLAALYMFWAMTAHMGIYAMLPTFLVSELGIPGTRVNTIVGLSRTVGLVVVFGAGALTDRFGVKRLLSVLGIAGGLLIIGIGLSSGWVLIALVAFQALTSASLFPAVLTTLSRVGPESSRNLNISLAVPFGYIFGGGLVPLGVGWIAEAVSFRIGFVVVGAMMAVYSLGATIWAGNRSLQI